MSLSFIRRLPMPLPDLERYYREQRKNDLSEGISLKTYGFGNGAIPSFGHFWLWTGNSASKP